MATSNSQKKHRVLSWLCDLILLLALGLLVLTGISHFFYTKSLAPVSFRAVQSGSMAPRMPVGSLVITKTTDPGEIHPGDIISTDAGGTILTHRVVAVHHNDGVQRFETKGDANAYADTRLTASANVLGKLVLVIPYLGYVALFFQQPAGWVFAACVLIGLWLLHRIIMLINKEKNTHEKVPY